MDKETNGMSQEVKNEVMFAEAPPRVSELRRFMKVFLGRPVVIIGLVIITIVLICAIIPNLIAPYQPNKQYLDSVLLPPSHQHLLGTDALGRDMLSRIIYGARTALIIASSVIASATIVGTVMGMTAGYFGGWIYSVIMRFVDALMAFPGILLALTICALLGGGMHMVIIALSIGGIPGYARVICAQAMSIRENDYIMASRSLGASNTRIMFVHLLPNAFPPMIVMMTMAVGMTILAEASLSYLGIGVRPPTIAWGSLVNDGNKYLLLRPVISLAPGISIMLVVYAFNMVGDGLRDALDPRLRGTL
jgi:ABC-type dipeptide/oligopeptide/nickel transport system permease subunit